MMVKKKVKMIALVVVAIFILIGIILGISMLKEYGSSGVGKGEEVTIEIKQGQGAWDIADTLKEEGLIKYRIVFLLKTRSVGAAAKLHYGTFSLYKGSGLETIIENLTTGGALKEEKMLTIPEGYTIELIAQKVEKEGFCTADEFLAAVEKDYDYWFLDSIPEDADVIYRLQGFLYPDTYAIGQDMTAEDIVEVMLKEFDKKFTKDMKAKADKLGKSIYEVVTEASIIQCETKLDKERVMVAGVIKNRLEKKMRLQIDPTFLYPLTNGLYNIENPTYEHTRLDSPYNTYQNYGLPVGPISSPGLPSLEAALNPTEHEYLYYHTDKTKNDGSHIFTKTYQEHINTQ